MKNNLHIVGVGGIGGWLIQLLIKSPHLPFDNVYLWDKDTVEDKNLQRQFFTKVDIGRPKVKAFKRMLREWDVECISDWFDKNSDKIDSNSIIMCCADNHAARKSCLEASDRTGAKVIIGANETIDAEAYLFYPSWKDGEKDPREFYPEINLTDKYDPTLAVRCTDDDVLEDTPQLAIANMLAASYMVFLFNLHMVEIPAREADPDYSVWRVSNSWGRVFSK